MLKTAFSFILFVVFVAGGAAQAQVSLNYSSQGVHHFTMRVADSWRINVGAEPDLSQAPEGGQPMSRIITAMPGDGTPLWFGMWVPVDLQKIEDAKEYMDSLGVDLLKEVSVKERKVETLNGMEVFYVSGTGQKESEVMDFHAAFVQLTKDTVVIAIYIGPNETTRTHGDELVGMVHSLQHIQQ